MPFKKAEDLGSTPLPLLVNIWGEPKTGKTQFLLSFPRPLWLFDFDHGYRELLQMHPELRKDLYYQSYQLPANPTLDQGEEILQQFVDDWYEAVQAPGGTVGLDTGTDLKSSGDLCQDEPEAGGEDQEAGGQDGQEGGPG
jgi:hypothetical protein